MQDAGFCSKNISFDDPPKRGHFSCGKLVPHLRTSTVSDSEALAHLAHVQHLWQSKLSVLQRLGQVEDWIVCRDATSYRQ